MRPPCCERCWQLHWLTRTKARWECLALGSFWWLYDLPVMDVVLAHIISHTTGLIVTLIGGCRHIGPVRTLANKYLSTWIAHC